MRVHLVYIAIWGLAMVLTVCLMVRKWLTRSTLRTYFRFLFQPWRLACFAIAGLGMTLIAPYTGDHTWDYVDAAVMAILTFLTAPWAVGVFYRVFRKQASLVDVYIALCLMLFSASWFYDAYIFWRDGVYPATWLQNLIISPTLYIAGGLFWNLDYEEGIGIRFAFQRADWFRVMPESGFGRIFWLALPFMIFATYSMVWFVWDFLYR